MYINSDKRYFSENLLHEVQFVPWGSKLLCGYLFTLKYWWGFFPHLFVCLVRRLNGFYKFATWFIFWILTLIGDPTTNLLYGPICCMGQSTVYLLHSLHRSNLLRGDLFTLIESPPPTNINRHAVFTTFISISFPTNSKCPTTSQKVSKNMFELKNNPWWNLSWDTWWNYLQRQQEDIKLRETHHPPALFIMQYNLLNI